MHTPAQLEKGRLLFARECNFLRGVVDVDGLPTDKRAEVAFVGRSNVGKSSLLNALTGRKTLAKVSVTPGRTRELNFFSLGDKLTLVDLPGYGYAKAPKTMVAAWQSLLRQYLMGRAQLRRALVLVDSRHGIKEPDLEMMKMLDDAAVPYQIILTKVDKISKQEFDDVVERVALVLKKHPAALPQLIATSSERRDGIDIVRAELAAFVESL